MADSLPTTTGLAPLPPLPPVEGLPLELLTALLNEAPARIGVIDAHHRYRYVNRATLEFLGMRAEDLIGRTIGEVRGEVVMKSYLNVVPRLVAGEALHWEGWAEYPGRARCYTEEWLLPFRTEGGEPLVLGYVRDVTDLKRHEIALKAQLEHIQRAEHLKTAIVDNALAAFVSTDDQGHIVEFNPAAERMFGCTRHEALGLSVAELMIPADQRAAHMAGMQRLANGGAPRVLGQRMEVQAQRRDGSRFPIEMVLWQTDVGGARHYTASIIDLSERRAAAELIERQRDALRHAEKLTAMGSLLAGVAHELNNPLAIAMGRAALLEEKAAGTAMADDARRIREAAERCGRIVRTFLNMARSQPSERQAVSLNELVQGAVDLLQYGLRTHGIALQVQLENGLPAVHADADQIGQIVLNLIVNAQQALAEAPQPRHLLLATGLETRREGREPRVWLRVQDNGPGVPGAQRDAIFEPFFTTKPVGLGTGLGLAVSRSLAREHGGELQLESSAQGASFRLSLPLSGQSGVAPVQEAPPPPEAQAAARVLVVDDEPEIAELIRHFLEAAGYEAVCAGSGREALEWLEMAQLDAVVSDLRMPDLDGSALWRELRVRWPHLSRRLLFVTGDTLSPGAREFLGECACPALAKPFSRADLLAALQCLLEEPCT